MYIEQFYTPGLAEAAYYVESEGQAAIIDPLRDVTPYENLAKERGASIRYIFETHLHTDFISGHIDLARETGAKVVFGPHSAVDFDAEEAQDNDIYYLGDVKFKVIHTPGHSLESVCYLLINDAGKDVALFTGDTLLVGKTGRPESLQDNLLEPEAMAGLLYDSIHKKLLKLDDDVIVYPAHVAGRYNGLLLDEERKTTIGQHRASNPLLQPISKEEFVGMLSGISSDVPRYYQRDKEINRTGYKNFSEVLESELQPVPLERFQQQMHEHLIIDTREAEDFAKGTVPGALNFGLSGRLSYWVATLLDDERPILLICEPGKEQESVTRLADVGFEHVTGYLKGGMEAWKASSSDTVSFSIIKTREFFELTKKGWKVIDVRYPSEIQFGYVPDSIHIPLTELEERLDELNSLQPYLVYSGTGYCSMIAISLLKSKGFIEVAHVDGGLKALSDDEQVSIYKPVKVA